MTEINILSYGELSHGEKSAHEDYDNFARLNALQFAQPIKAQ